MLRLEDTSLRIESSVSALSELKILKDIELSQDVPNYCVHFQGLHGEWLKITKFFDRDEPYEICYEDIDSDGLRILNYCTYLPSLVLIVIKFVVTKITSMSNGKAVFEKSFVRDQNTIKMIDENNYVVFSRECLNDCTLIRPLGRGHFGSVYLAKDNNDKEYAIKLIHLGGPDYPIVNGISENFNREVQIIRELDSCGIGPKLYSISYHGTIPWMFGIIITDVWSGELKSKDILNQSLVDKLFKQVKAIHKLGYVHGDVFPRNILVKRFDDKVIDITITDFGSADTIAGWKKQLFGQWGVECYERYLFSKQTKDWICSNNVDLESMREDPSLMDYPFIHHLRDNLSSSN